MGKLTPEAKLSANKAKAAAAPKRNAPKRGALFENAIFKDIEAIGNAAIRSSRTVLREGPRASVKISKNREEVNQAELV